MQSDSPPASQTMSCSHASSLVSVIQPAPSETQNIQLPVPLLSPDVSGVQPESSQSPVSFLNLVAMVAPIETQFPIPLPQCSSSTSSDLGTYSAVDINGLDNRKRHWILKNAYRPTTDYKFPAKQEYGKSRSFQHTWLKEYTWLSYSCCANGGYCTPCFLFAKNCSSLGQLVNTPMNNFTRAKKTLQDHSTQKIHRIAMEDATAFLGQMESGHLSINQQLQSQAAETFMKNRLILKSILKGIIFCGRQNIALQGHRELSNLSEKNDTGINPGNFQALLQLQMECGDNILKV